MEFGFGEEGSWDSRLGLTTGLLTACWVALGLGKSSEQWSPTSNRSSTTSQQIQATNGLSGQPRQPLLQHRAFSLNIAAKMISLEMCLRLANTPPPHSCHSAPASRTRRGSGAPMSPPAGAVGKGRRERRPSLPGPGESIIVGEMQCRM